MNYYGFKLGLRVSRQGMITNYPLLDAQTHDVNHLGALIEGFSGYVPADKGFLDKYQEELWMRVKQFQVITPIRKNMQNTPEQACQQNKILAKTGRNSWFAVKRKISNIKNQG